MPEHSVCAELGVHLGDFASRIIDVVKPRKLHLIDPWKYETESRFGKAKYGAERGVDQAHMDARYQSTMDRFEPEIRSGRVVVHRDAASSVAEFFPDEYFDWIYIDGNHLYEFVLQDLRLYYSKVRPRGFITGDDYDIEGWWMDGVTEAVDEFVAEANVELVGIKSGQFVLKKLSPRAIQKLIRLETAAIITI